MGLGGVSDNPHTQELRLCMGVGGLLGADKAGGAWTFYEGGRKATILNKVDCQVAMEVCSSLLSCGGARSQHQAYAILKSDRRSYLPKALPSLSRVHTSLAKTSYRIPIRDHRLSLSKTSLAKRKPPTQCTSAADNVRPETEIDPLYLPSGWKKMAPLGHATSLGIASLLLATVFHTDLSPIYRLSVLTYAISTSTEWAIHKYYMHRTDEVHLLHHRETNRDMTMPKSFNIDAVQFPLSATAGIFFTYIMLLCTLIFCLQLEIPYWYTIPCMCVVSFLHSGLWNTLHPDTHDIVMNGGDTISDSQSFGYTPWLPRQSAVWRWLIVNHTGHHTITGNYNCVFPGMDHIMGTFWHRK
ncbi:hypothetical protein CYMTET_44062 [Cymbomonas tetramitiformis]|uniref:Uncharacterized protein n=1 Tax=Cymbomonas tetramitiformis TaxID=36881 RepID=A0AAE0C317_9CHLO|nr:hypothetical protein CYMTET_44062 [Cymbomonas tetramitiformis]